MVEQATDYKQVVRDAARNDDTFLRLTMTGKRKGEETSPYVKIIVRPVMIREQRHLQFSYFDGKKDITKNFSGEAVLPPLDEALELPFKQFHVQLSIQDIRVRMSKQGDVHISRSKPSLSDAPDLSHNKTKSYLLAGGKKNDFLHKIDITDESGKVKPSMQSKYRQIHEFLSRLEPMIHDHTYPNGEIEIVDCGCGSAYLTFAAYNYLKFNRELHPHIVGIDRDSDIIEKCRMLRDNLKWKDLDFYVSSISHYTPEKNPEMVLSLHACNTATDEAIARGIFWGSQTIIVAPCCQHELRPQIKASSMQSILRYGLLKQRMAEIVTDAVRAQILRIMGYKTGVVEFVYPSHTPKNLMIRAEKVRDPGDPQLVREYLELKEFWHVDPRLERLLGDPFTELLD